jgi:hypothetical protein
MSFKKKEKKEQNQINIPDLDYSPKLETCSILDPYSIKNPNFQPI